MSQHELEREIAETFAQTKIKPELLQAIESYMAEKAEVIESLSWEGAEEEKDRKRFYETLKKEIRTFGKTLDINPENISDTCRFGAKEYSKMTYEYTAETRINRKIRKYSGRFGMDYRIGIGSNLVKSFSAAKEAVKENDLGVVVGPEGFIFAPLFELLDFPLRNIHIDEYCTTEDRPYKELDDLSAIRGKKVLFIEDDVRSGKTLRKAADKIEVYSPESLSVYLGAPMYQQDLHSVPRKFKAVYTQKELSQKQHEEELESLLKLMHERYGLFKREGE